MYWSFHLNFCVYKFKVPKHSNLWNKVRLDFCLGDRHKKRFETVEYSLLL